MPLDALRCFYELAEHQSYPNAAQALGIRPKVLSDTVKTLEQQMGVLLLAANRGLRTVQLTRAGETLKTLSPKFFAEQARLREQVQAAGERLLRVAISGGGALLEAESLIRLRQPASAYRPFFTLVRMPLTRQRAGIVQGEFDVGLSQAPVSTEDQGLIVEAAWREPLVALLPKDHLLALHDTLYLSMLADYRLILADKRFDEFGSQIDRLLHVREIVQRSLRQEAASPSEVILASRSGAGVGLLGATQWTHSNHLAPLIARVVVDEQTREPLWLTTYVRRPLTVKPVLTQAMAQFKARLAGESMNPSAAQPSCTPKGDNDASL